MKTQATSVSAYLDALPADRAEALQACRKVILDNLDDGFEEGIQYGMIGYFVPHRIFPDGYHVDSKQPLPFAALASQKSHMAVYLHCVYQSSVAEKRFRERWLATGKKLDMGKSCIRFKRLEDMALNVLGATIRETTAKKFIANYQAVLQETRKK